MSTEKCRHCKQTVSSEEPQHVWRDPASGEKYVWHDNARDPEKDCFNTVLHQPPQYQQHVQLQLVQSAERG